MIAPQWDWAVSNIRKNILVMLEAAALVALGVGISVAALSVLVTIDQDPIPGRSTSLYFPLFDPRSALEAATGSAPPNSLSWIDANNLVQGGRPGSVAMTAGGTGKAKTAITPYPTKMNLRYANAAFFGIFDVPFLYGTGWSAKDDFSRARYAVLSSDAAAELFGAANPVGREITLDGTAFVVMGVTSDWHPMPRFYDLSRGGFNTSDEIFVPLETAMDLKMAVAGNFSCWGDGWSHLSDLKGADCGWLTVWAYLPEQSTKNAYSRFLANYYASQRSLGRFELPTNVSLMNVNEYLADAELVTPEVKLQTYLALGLLVVCLINASSLLLSLSLRRRREFALRRALGAAQIDIVSQAVFEGVLIGSLAGLLAAAVSWGGLHLLGKLPTLYSAAIHVDIKTLVIAVLLSVAASVLSSLAPAWISARARPIDYLNVE